jgi:hypothetical protein
VALASGRVDAALRWVSAAREAEVEQAFRQALAVRRLGTEAQALADRYFFETLVRIHREGEGASFTGLKPAGHVEPAIAAADHALEGGSVDPLVNLGVRDAERARREAFARATAARRLADVSVERGREAVAAYVAYVHLTERLLAAAKPSPDHEHQGTHSAP